MRPFRTSTGSVHPACHRLVHVIWREINDQRVCQEDLAKRAGVSASAIRKWRQGQRSPNLNDLEAVLNVLGYAVTVRQR